MSFPWKNFLAVLELLILVCSSALPHGTLSTCLSGTPIVGSGHVLLYPLDTVPTWGALGSCSLTPISVSYKYLINSRNVQGERRTEVGARGEVDTSSCSGSIEVAA